MSGWVLDCWSDRTRHLKTSSWSAGNRNSIFHHLLTFYGLNDESINLKKYSVDYLIMKITISISPTNPNQVIPKIFVPTKKSILVDLLHLSKANSGVTNDHKISSTKYKSPPTQQ